MSKPAKLKFTIYQGATFSEKWQRLLCDYAVELRNGQLVNSATGAPVPDADLTPDDYTGCTARMQARADVDSPFILFELTTENGGITLGPDGWMQTDRSAIETAAMKYGDVADPANGIWSDSMGQVEVVRPGGIVERQYEITYTLSQEGTR